MNSVFRVFRGSPEFIRVSPLGPVGMALASWLLCWTGAGAAAEAPPQIQPSVTFQHTAVNVGATNTFTVVATGDALSYQWQLDGQDLPGETNQTCIRTNAQPADEGDYTVAITNVSGAVTSAPARLWVVPPATDFVKGNYTNNVGERLPYFYLLPANYNPGRSYPLHCLFHGMPGHEGMITNALPGYTGYGNMPALKVTASYRQQTRDPVILFWPTRRTNDASWTDAYLRLVSAKLDELLTEFNVDTNRIYVAGGSEGVHAVWDMIAMRPGFFAGAFFAAGSQGSAPPVSVKEVPGWAWCAADDDSVGVTRQLVDAVRRVGGTPIYTEYLTGGHLGGIFMGSCTPAIIDWMLAQRRGVPSTAEPLLSITSPTTENTYTTTGASLDLAGSAQALGEMVTGVTWENTLNNATGQALGGNSWSVTGLPLEPLATNVIRLTATTTSWSAGYGGNTTFSTTLSVLQSCDRLVLYAQPTDQFVRLGSNVTFSVSACSPAPITYQWQWNGTNILDATHATLTLTNVQAENDGLYDVVVSDDFGSVVSDPARLTVLLTPRITLLATNYAVVQGGTVILSVECTGALPMSYRWRSNFTTLKHETLDAHQSFLVLPNVQPEMGGPSSRYTVVLTNAAFMTPGVLSSNIYLTVLADTDADGLPDVWETQYGLNDATADDDNDGQSNGAEYVAGTDPTNALSYLKVDSITLADGESAAALGFLAVSNRTYTVQYRESLENGEWTRLADVVAVSSNRVVEISDAGAGTAARRFYRLVTPRAR